MKAQDKFELLAPRYRKAYFENNSVNVNVSYRNGFVLVNSSKYRVSQFEQMTKNLEDRLIEKLEEWISPMRPFKLREENIFTNKKWYSENGTVYNEEDKTVRIALVFDNGSYTSLPIEIANKLSQLLNK
jgi:hypothetical protein